MTEQEYIDLCDLVSLRNALNILKEIETSISSIENKKIFKIREQIKEAHKELRMKIKINTLEDDYYDDCGI
jgi:hypothetical protein